MDVHPLLDPAVEGRLLVQGKIKVVKVWVTKSLVPEEKHDWLNLLLRKK
jgi:hypothetical protein